ncbi:MAG: 23S rRNA (adenine(2503)-C(2))-methyltransferase RlmN [Verrucomicrobia bacterium]|nr:MAG: 23S rRNA (adenine(2503)-C(2))-methyltransferase RlmN [Verrucomicrobiota bacterium]
MSGKRKGHSVPGVPPNHPFAAFIRPKPVRPPAPSKKRAKAPAGKKEAGAKPAAGPTGRGFAKARTQQPPRRRPGRPGKRGPARDPERTRPPASSERVRPSARRPAFRRPARPVRPPARRARAAAKPARVDLRSLDYAELHQILSDMGEPAFRTVQLAIWLYKQRATRWDQMTNVPQNLRRRLAGRFTLHTLEPVTIQGSTDTTRKFLWRLPDGALIESVLLPANPAAYGEGSDRVTLCVSTQVGCAYGCRFCASGLNGWRRNLEPFEIVEQVLAVERWHAAQHPGLPPGARLIDNLVIMGMGEPLANYDRLLKALRILNAPWGGGIGARRITISTCGLAPEIRRLAAEPEQFGLALSLHGATDEVRERLMPVNRRYPLAEVTAACREYLESRGRLITLEYILIKDVNDGLDQIEPLARIARDLRAKVNLIPYNHVDGLPWERPSEEAQEAFLAALEARGVRVTLRREKGHDIDAACGQLRLRTEAELAAKPGTAEVAEAGGTAATPAPGPAQVPPETEASAPPEPAAEGDESPPSQPPADHD